MVDEDVARLQLIMLQWADIDAKSDETEQLMKMSDILFFFFYFQVRSLNLIWLGSRKFM